MNHETVSLYLNRHSSSFTTFWMDINTVAYPLSLVAAAVIYEVNRRWRVQRRTGGLPYPPGPPPRPIIGNIHQMPSEFLWLTFAEWGKQYGPLTYLNLAGQPILVLNSHQASIDLLEKRGNIYSDRAPSVMCGELVALHCSDPARRTSPRAATTPIHALNPRVIHQNFAAIQERRTTELLAALIDKPSNFSEEIRYYVGATLAECAIGKLKDGNVDFVEQGRHNTKILFDAVAGWTVDFIPALKYLPDWFPGADFKRKAKVWRQALAEGQSIPFEMVKRLRDSGEAKNSFVSILLDDNSRKGGSADGGTLIKEVLGGFFGGGYETGQAVLHVFILAMTLFPEIQKRAQEEIDRVTAGRRLPTLDDRDALPYITNVLLETLRWHPIGPVDIPHRLTMDDTYNGYFIPAGTIVFPNNWSTAKDPVMYPNPDEFNPDRFSGDAIKSGKVIDPADFVYGFGQRICPVFDIRKSIDPNTGKEIVPETKFQTGFVSNPEPFVCNIRPRSEASIALIRQAISSLPKD